MPVVFHIVDIIIIGQAVKRQSEQMDTDSAVLHQIFIVFKFHTSPVDHFRGFLRITVFFSNPLKSETGNKPSKVFFIGGQKILMIGIPVEFPSISKEAVDILLLFSKDLLMSALINIERCHFETSPA